MLECEDGLIDETSIDKMWVWPEYEFSVRQWIALSPISGMGSQKTFNKIVTTRAYLHGNQILEIFQPCAPEDIWGDISAVLLTYGIICKPLCLFDEPVVDLPDVSGP